MNISNKYISPTPTYGRARNTDLVILRRKLVEALLNDMVPVEVLNEDNDVQAQGHDDSVNLSVEFEVSLPRLVSDISEQD